MIGAHLPGGGQTSDEMCQCAALRSHPNSQLGRGSANTGNHPEQQAVRLRFTCHGSILANLLSLSSSKKSLSVESPSFTPAANIPTGPKRATLSTSAATAPAFTPRGLEGETDCTSYARAQQISDRGSRSLVTDIRCRDGRVFRNGRGHGRCCFFFFYYYLQPCQDPRVYTHSELRPQLIRESIRIDFGQGYTQLTDWPIAQWHRLVLG